MIRYTECHKWFLFGLLSLESGDNEGRRFGRRLQLACLLAVSGNKDDNHEDSEDESTHERCWLTDGAKLGADKGRHFRRREAHGTAARRSDQAYYGDNMRGSVALCEQSHEVVGCSL
jgi:hypothetical protein